MATKIGHYDVGDIWRPQFTFTVSGVNTDPTTLTVTQQAADGTETVLAAAVNPGTLTGSSTPVAKSSTGVFILNPGITLSAPGYWFVKVAGTGAAAASETQQAIVDPDEIGTDTTLDSRALVSLPETKAWLESLNQDTGDDLIIASLINAASNTIHEVAGREFKVIGTNPQTRDFDLEPWVWYADRTVPVGDLSSFTQAQIISYDLDGNVADTTTLSNVIAKPRTRRPWEPITRLEFALSVIAPFTAYRPVFRVVGNFGFPSVPYEVKQACLDTVAFWHDRDVEQYQQDLGIPQSESANTVIIGRGPNPTQILPLPPEAHARVAQYRQYVLV